MKNFIRVILLIFLGVVAGFILGREINSSVLTPRVLITAAHIPETEFEGLDLIYKDVDADVAIYNNPAYVASQIPIGSNVTYGDFKGTVVESSNTEFILRPEDPSLTVRGLSGTVVFFKGNPVGFISAMVAKGDIRCVYY